MIGSSTSLLAMIGEDILLPCHIVPGTDIRAMTLEWARLDLNPRFVHLRRDGVEFLINQNPSYVGRTSLSTDKLQHGDMSLMLSKVKLSDEGEYRCHIPGQETLFVELVVGSVSSPVIIIKEITDKELLLECESKGWYPEPEVLWLDHEGKDLSAGPTETIRGPDGLYSVSSRVTVEMRHSDILTCRVHQRNITQTRETRVQFQDEAPVAPPSSAARITMIFFVCFMALSVVLFVLWKLRQQRGNDWVQCSSETPGGRGEEEQFVEESKNMKGLEDKLQEKEQEKNDMQHVISIMEEQKTELEISKATHISKLEKVEKEWRENEKKLNNDKMFQLKEGRSPKLQLSFSSIVIVIHTAGLLLLTQSSEGQYQVVSPLQPVFTITGDDIFLPCHLEPAIDAVSMAVEWTKMDMYPRFVHVRRGGQDLLDGQNPKYEGRTSLSMNKLKLGDVSLKLSKVKISDAGTYKCLIPGINRDAFIRLVVGAVSSPVISGIKRSTGGLELQCESKGWYPEPEVFWLDDNGNHLSAGPTKTFRGPDGLYTVSSRVTVEKRESIMFTCRVHQGNITQTRETRIQIQDDVFPTKSNCIARILAVSLAGVLLFSVVFFLLWKLKQKKDKKKVHRGQNRKNRKRLDDELQEEEPGVLDLISILEEHEKELKRNMVVQDGGLCGRGPAPM
ncbi:butyrophilin-like protein 2 [Notolabrus celidotus]|uniref:butyrophilin-like protein 2 n=1 Tax=Notolabrus celidotus TaxID=1203425 RepID=UPI00148F912D|nr:butyrophilin-like protein 2 [Notolabrus celidotus]